MTTTPVLRSGLPADLVAVQDLAANVDGTRWGGLPRLTETLLAQRWRQRQLPPALIQVVEMADRVQGYSDIRLASPTMATFDGVASGPDAARALIDWACKEANRRTTDLHTTLFVIEAGVAVRPRVADRPVYSLLADAGFRVSSTTRRMRLPRTREPLIKPIRGLDQVARQKRGFVLLHKFNGLRHRIWRHIPVPR